VGGFENLPVTSVSVAGNWLAARAPFRIGPTASAWALRTVLGWPLQGRVNQILRPNSARASLTGSARSASFETRPVAGVVVRAQSDRRRGIGRYRGGRLSGGDRDRADPWSLLVPDARAVTIFLKRRPDAARALATAWAPLHLPGSVTGSLRRTPMSRDGPIVPAGARDCARTRGPPRP
jgi:hypothetical protein